jgi:hypothetical protein
MDCISDDKIKTKLYNIKQEIEQIKFPPNYYSDLDFYIKNRDAFNCYAYAMQFRMIASRIGNFPWYCPGFLSNSIPAGEYYNKDSLLNGFINDCKFLGISCEETDINCDLENNSYKIAIFIEPTKAIYFPNPDYHFIRQNDDLNWSEKECWEGKVNLLTNPTHKYYQLVKVMKISKIK